MLRISTCLSYERYSLAWYRILEEADYRTKLKFRLVSQAFAAAVDDILGGEGLLVVPPDLTLSSVKAQPPAFDDLSWGVRSKGAFLPCFHRKGNALSQMKAVQKASAVVFRTDSCPTINTILKHVVRGTKVLLVHNVWWTVDVCVPPEVCELALIPDPDCACNHQLPPTTSFSHSAATVRIDLDLGDSGVKTHSEGLGCHLLKQWWSPSVRMVCFRIDGPLAVIKAALRHLFSCVDKKSRSQLMVFVTLNDITLTKLDHRWMDKEFAILGIDNHMVVTFDRATRTFANEKHGFYKLEWEFLESWRIEKMLGSNAAVVSPTSDEHWETAYIPPNKRSLSTEIDRPPCCSCILSGGLHPSMAAHLETELSLDASECHWSSQEGCASCTELARPSHFNDYLRPLHGSCAGPERPSIDNQLAPEDAENEIPPGLYDNDEVPVAVGDDTYRIGTRLYTLNPTIKVSVNDSRYRPMRCLSPEPRRHTWF